MVENSKQLLLITVRERKKFQKCKSHNKEDILQDPLQKTDMRLTKRNFGMNEIIPLLIYDLLEQNCTSSWGQIWMLC